MNIFIDLDDTLYNTSSVIQGNKTADVLLAELYAPVFENAKETIEDINARGHKCIAISARGIMDNEEVDISKRKLAADGFMHAKDNLISACITYVARKFDGIEIFYKSYSKQDKIDTNNTILIDNDFSQIVSVATKGITTIFFMPNPDAIDQDSQTLINKLSIRIASSWIEIGQIIKDIEFKNEL